MALLNTELRFVARLVDDKVSVPVADVILLVGGLLLAKNLRPSAAVAGTRVAESAPQGLREKLAVTVPNARAREISGSLWLRVVIWAGRCWPHVIGRLMCVTAINGGWNLTVCLGP